MSRARRAAVLGSPIEHSLSPVLHRAAYRALGLDWDYSAIEVGESGLGEFWETLDDTWMGLSLTMPLKVAVLPLLDEVSDRARRIGAVNTVVLKEGRSFGHNTDIPGMIRALDEVQVDRGAIGSASIIGAGATARSAVAAILERHGGQCAITVFARRAEQARELAERVATIGAAVETGTWERLADGMAADLVVSTLPGGQGLPAPVPDEPGVLFDVAYDPWPTPACAAWRAARGLVVTGAELLLWQAAEQVTLMTGRQAPVETMRSALVAALDDRASAPI